MYIKYTRMNNVNFQRKIKAHLVKTCLNFISKLDFVISGYVGSEIFCCVELKVVDNYFHADKSYRIQPYLYIRIQL